MKKEYKALEIEVLRLGLLNVTNATTTSDILEGVDDGEYDPDAQ